MEHAAAAIHKLCYDRPQTGRSGIYTNSRRQGRSKYAAMPAHELSAEANYRLPISKVIVGRRSMYDQLTSSQSLGLPFRDFSTSACYAYYSCFYEDVRLVRRDRDFSSTRKHFRSPFTWSVGALYAPAFLNLISIGPFSTHSDCPLSFQNLRSQLLRCQLDLDNSSHALLPTVF